MARVYITDNKIRVLYTVTNAVGQGCPNNRDDVLLVQFFLKAISEAPDRVGYAPPGYGPMRCDGWWGGQSQAYLDNYIRKTNEIPEAENLNEDGRVDPVVGGKMRASYTGTFYTILSMNGSYRNSYGQEAQLDISKDRNFPMQLTPALKVEG